MPKEVSESTLQPLHWYQDKITVTTTVSLVALGLICAFGAVYAQWTYVGVINVAILSGISGASFLAALLPPLILHYSRKKERPPEPEKLEADAVGEKPPVAAPATPPVPRSLQHVFSDPRIAPPPSGGGSTNSVPRRLQHVFSPLDPGPPPPSSSSSPRSSSPPPSLVSLQRRAHFLDDSALSPQFEVQTPSSSPSSLYSTPVGVSERALPEESPDGPYSDEEGMVLKDDYDNTLLHKLAKKPNGTVVFRKALRHRRGLVSERNTYGQTPVHSAVMAKSLGRIEALVMAEADLTVVDLCGNTALHNAITGGQLEIVKLFVAEEKGLAIKNGDEETPLHLAARSGDVTIALLLMLKLEKEDLNATNKSGETAMHIAARGGFDEVIEALIAHGAALDVKSATGRTPLHIAAINSHLKTAKCLVELGASPNAQDKDKNTPLHLACINKLLAMTILLKRLGKELKEPLNLDLKNSDGNEALICLDKHQLTDNDWTDALELLDLHGLAEERDEGLDD
ncbi:MAG: Phosphocholine transferase AnkX [Chlamydiae bacterium]|nr:Phosphocholine transferase AnkX [Chlamydiota bacterium]